MSHVGLNLFVGRRTLPALDRSKHVSTGFFLVVDVADGFSLAVVALACFCLLLVGFINGVGGSTELSLVVVVVFAMFFPLL